VDKLNARALTSLSALPSYAVQDIATFLAREKELGFIVGLSAFSTEVERYIRQLTKEQEHERSADIDEHRTDRG
jgi:hypothetical protein